MKTRSVVGSLALTLALASPGAGCQEADDEVGTDGETAIVMENATQLTQVRRVHDRVIDGASGARLEVTIIADGAGIGRRVGVHASVDGGPWSDVSAVRTADRNAATDVWTATVTPVAGFTSIEYVVWAEPLAGARRWDSNAGANYRTAARRTVAWAGAQLDDGALVIDLDVENLAYDKACIAVFTTDDWARARYTLPGHYVGATGRAGIERWQVRIEPSADLGVALDRAAVVEYAVSCRFGDSSEARWDNNLGRNFRHERATPPVLGWKTPFAAALDVELAPDGTVFALSTSDPPFGATPGSRRWMTIYGPDGASHGVVTFPVDAERITYIADAELVIAELWAPDAAQVRRMAIRRDGTIAWDQTSARGWMTDAVGAAFLVRGGEVARLEANAPVGVACVDPTVSPSGIAACVGAGATRVVDVDSGTLVATLPAGEPYAISDDGDVVVLGLGAEVSGYTTSLIAYHLDGTVAWQRPDLFAPPDHGWGGLRVLGDCTNHVIDDVVGFVDQPPTGTSVLLLDVHTGNELRRVAINGGVVQACPGEDERFHWNSSYMRYGRWTDALDPADPIGTVVHADVGLNGSIGGLVPGGRVAYVQKPYIAPSGDTPQPRLVIAEPGGERFSDYLVVPAGASPPLIDAAGTHAVVFTGHELLHLEM